MEENNLFRRRPVIRHGGGGYEYIDTLNLLMRRCKHLLRSLDSHTLDARRFVQADRATDQDDFRAGISRGTGQAEAHFPGAAVRDVTNRVDGLASRPGRYHDCFSL